MMRFGRSAPRASGHRTTRPATLAAVATILPAAVAGFAGQARALSEGPAQSPPRLSAAPLSLPLADHRATYRLTLDRALGAKSPTSARGRVNYEFTGSACDGYSQTFRQVTEMQPAEGATRVSDMHSATFEDGSGRSFSYDVRTRLDHDSPEVVDGHAERKGDDLLAIHLSQPAAQTIDVDNKVLFPTAHLMRIIGAAKAGQHFLNAKVFDGSDNGKTVYDTTTIIGRPIGEPAPDLGAASAAMVGMTRWPVSISYFEEGRKDESPVYTLGFELYENGVSRALRFDYGDFTLAGELQSLDLLAEPPCR